MHEALLEDGHGVGDLLERTHTALLHVGNPLIHALAESVDLRGHPVIQQGGGLDRLQPLLIVGDELGEAVPKRLKSIGLTLLPSRQSRLDLPQGIGLGA